MVAARTTGTADIPAGRPRRAKAFRSRPIVPASSPISVPQARRPFRANPDCRGRSDLGDEGSSVEGSGSAEGVDGPLATDDGGGRAADPDVRRADRRYALLLTVLGVLGGGAGVVLVYTAAAVLG